MGTRNSLCSCTELKLILVHRSVNMAGKLQRLTCFVNETDHTEQDTLLVSTLHQQKQ